MNLRALMSLTLISCSQVSWSGDVTPRQNCGHQVPASYADLKSQYTGKKIVLISAWLSAREELKKPYKADDINDWLKMYQVDNFCASGRQDNRKVHVKTKGILRIPESHSNTGKTQIYAFETTVRYDPDRESGSVEKTHYMDLTQSFESGRK